MEVGTSSALGPSSVAVFLAIGCGCLRKVHAAAKGLGLRKVARQVACLGGGDKPMEGTGVSLETVETQRTRRWSKASKVRTPSKVA
jgi:hypothetical protein